MALTYVKGKMSRKLLHEWAQVLRKSHLYGFEPYLSKKLSKLLFETI